MTKMRITLMGEDNVRLVEHLCAVTGMTPPSLIALMLRKYGKELESWVDYPLENNSQPQTQQQQPLEFPSDPGAHLNPIDL